MPKQALKRGVLVCLGSHKKTPYRKWTKTKNSFSLVALKVASLRPWTRRCGVWGSLTLGLKMALCVLHGEKEIPAVFFSSYRRLWSHPLETLYPILTSRTFISFKVRDTQREWQSVWLVPNHLDHVLLFPGYQQGLGLELGQPEYGCEFYRWQL